MQLTKDQELTVLWSMLHEPGDGLAREIFDSRGPKAIRTLGPKGPAGSGQSVWGRST